MLYHAVSILSCRTSSHQEASPSSASYLCRKLSAARVMVIARDESSSTLCNLPIIPYAISLSLRVFYRELRLSKLPIFRAQARKDLLECCQLLRDTGDVFWSIVDLANLAEDTVREMDKAISQMSSSSSGNVQASLQRQPIVLNNTSTCDRSNDLANADTTRQQDPLMDDDYTQQPTSDIDTDPLDFTGLEDISEFDIFKYFDPDFDIGAVDAALSNENPFMNIETWTVGT